VSSQNIYNIIMLTLINCLKVGELSCIIIEKMMTIFSFIDKFVFIYSLFENADAILSVISLYD